MFHSDLSELATQLVEQSAKDLGSWVRHQPLLKCQQREKRKKMQKLQKVCLLFLLHHLDLYYKTFYGRNLRIFVIS
jgi:hypothetical protein